MVLDNLVSIPAPIDEAVPQLEPGTWQIARQITQERLTNPDVRNVWFYTADGPVYHTPEDEKSRLIMTPEEFSPVAQNVGEACRQLRATRNYAVPGDQFAQARQAVSEGKAIEVILENLGLQRHDNEFSFFDLPTTPSGYDRLNPDQRKLAEWAYGQGEDFAPAMNLVRTRGQDRPISVVEATRIWVLNPGYVQAKTAEGTALARASRLGRRDGGLGFGASDPGVDNSDVRVRGVRRGAAAEGGAAETLGVNFSELFGSQATNYGAMYDAMLKRPEDAVRALNELRAVGMREILKAYERLKK